MSDSVASGPCNLKFSTVFNLTAAPPDPDIPIYVGPAVLGPGEPDTTENAPSQNARALHTIENCGHQCTTDLNLDLRTLAFNHAEMVIEYLW